MDEPPKSLGSKELWEILVPVANADGVPHSKEFHGEWDRLVEMICGAGMTLFDPAKGRWSHEGRKIEEAMIPVRILCTEEEIDRIVDITLVFFHQIEVLAYRVSDKIILKRRPGL